MAPKPDYDDAAARRAKKRELDRRAQRASRERTRTRIAYLEATVQAMTHQESSDRMASLMDQLVEMTRQRDELSRTLSSIESTVHAHREGEKVVAAGPDPAQVEGNPPPSQWSRSHNNLVDIPLPPTDDTAMDLLTPGAIIDLCPLPSNTFDLSVAEFHDAVTPPAGMSSCSLPQQTHTELDSIGSPSHHAKLVIFPEPDKPCDCIPSTTQPGPLASTSLNIWRSANEALSGPGLLPNHTLRYEDTLREDIPVRVILEGWDAVERSQNLPPLWKKLRRTDELQFSSCGKTERLAILRLMHTLLRYQAEPTAEQYAKLPPWYLSRPSQSLPHSSAIDFFVWPGVRERFVFSQHQYCSNFFWKTFADSFRIVWPFEFRDCFKRNMETGLYSVSPDFGERIHEIQSWTMAPDFFQHFPEMYADIPVFQSIPQPFPSWLQVSRQKYKEGIRSSKEPDYGKETFENNSRGNQKMLAIEPATSVEEADWLNCHYI